MKPKLSVKKTTIVNVPVFIVIIFSLLLFSGCGDDVTELSPTLSKTGTRGSSTGLPIDQIRNSLIEVPTYSIILENMKEEGFFSKKYFHKYRVAEVKKGWTTEWLQVPKKYYMANESFLGMTLFSKKDGVADSTVGPPGYAYVGDSRYGQWRENSSGGSFWEFYGKYALLSHLFGGWYRPINRVNYGGYRSNKSRGKTFFGNKRQYGSSGTITKKVKPNFYARRMGKANAGSSWFKSNVQKRIGRTKTSFRGRAGGFGK